MKTYIIKAETYYDTLAARAALGDYSIKYTMGITDDYTYIVFAVNFFTKRKVMKRLEGEKTRGAKFDIIETL